MGYTTDFNGDFAVTPPLTPEHRDYLKAFNNTRRVRRDADKAELLPDPVRIAAGLPIGYEGAYFVGGTGVAGQDHDDSVIDGNEPPGSIPYRLTDDQSGVNANATAHKLGLAQPGLWCQWTPSDDGGSIAWDDGEKFYNYIEWIEYLLAHFLVPWGYSLTGEVHWEGEDSDDRGVIRITDNTVEIGTAVVSYTYNVTFTTT
jgi:hypothetical protein